jgi:hypothetical protein
MSGTITIEQGSGNVFEDLGYPNAEEALTKARLAQRIAEVLEKKRGSHKVKRQSCWTSASPKYPNCYEGGCASFLRSGCFAF